ncbi:hypothetical protein M2146_001095 [Lachnospiraceae bacterium PF1-22]
MKMYLKDLAKELFTSPSFICLIASGILSFVVVKIFDLHVEEEYFTFTGFNFLSYTFVLLIMLIETMILAGIEMITSKKLSITVSLKLVFLTVLTSGFRTIITEIFGESVHSYIMVFGLFYSTTMFVLELLEIRAQIVEERKIKKTTGRID